MISSQVPGKNEFCAVILGTQLTLKPSSLVNAFLVGIQRFLRAQCLMTNITAKPDSAVNIVSVFPKTSFGRELLITLRAILSHLLVIFLDVKS